MTDAKIKLGVLWKHLSREGKTPYLSGRVQRDNLDAAVRLLHDGGRFLVLSSKKRPDKQDPDCELFVVPEPERHEDRPSVAPAAVRPAPASADQSRQRTNAGGRGGR
ncbi:MAG: hypothetical protein H6Q33_1212 [Deltaproteobacteria bacterium]|nr:hypothetical protein [Deltaproteobacteria bacterium]